MHEVIFVPPLISFLFQGGKPLDVDLVLNAIPVPAKNNVVFSLALCHACDKPLDGLQLCLAGDALIGA